MKLKIGDKVRSIEDHYYLGLTKRNIGTILSINNYSVEVSFRKKLPILFQASELKKITKRKKK